jgi:hypothetical protein
MSDIFISYELQDRDKAKAFAEFFQQQDWSVSGFNLLFELNQRWQQAH